MIAILAATVAWADDEEKTTGWADAAEFSFVATDGNSNSTSLGFKNTATRKWNKADLIIRATVVRVETESGDRVAQELPGGGFVVIDPPTEVSAENYELVTRYNRNVSDRFYWYGGATWQRDEPAGIKNRYIAEAGVGNTWHDTDDLLFKTSYGATFNDEEDVIPDPTRDDSYGGARAVSSYMQKLGKTKNMTYTNLLVTDLNLDQTSDWRVDMDQGFAVTMTKTLAMKLGLRSRYRNDPSLETLTLLDVGGTPVGTVSVPLDDWDITLTAGLVVNFP